jgi:hypothetical protein
MTNVGKARSDKRWMKKILAIWSQRDEILYRRGGDRKLLLKVIEMYFASGWLLPKWAREAFLEAYYSYPKSWDDVFGKPPRRDTPEQARIKQEVVNVAREVRRLHAEGEGDPIDDGLFEKVAEKLGMRAGTVKNWRYYGKYGEYRKKLEAVEAATREREQLREREGNDAVVAMFIAAAKRDLADVRARFPTKRTTQDQLRAELKRAIGRERAGKTYKSPKLARLITEVRREADEARAAKKPQTAPGIR